MRRLNILCFLLYAFFASAYCQSQTPWKGKRAAVVLTYDDALDAHIDRVYPLLKKHDLVATFYLIGSSPVVLNRASEWRAIAHAGNELGNHTLFHPCNGGTPERAWVSAAYDLRFYSHQRLLDEIALTNRLLYAIDSQQTRSFAYTCGDQKIADSFFYPSIAHLVVGARAVTSKRLMRNEVDIRRIPAYMIQGESFQTMKQWVDLAIEEGSLLVFLFHGVGNGHNILVNEQDHESLLAYLASRRNMLFMPTLRGLVQFLIDTHQH